MTENKWDGIDCNVRIVHRDRVRQARDRVIVDDKLDRMVSTFKLLGDSSRLKILMALKEVEMCVCDLAAFLGISESAVSHQLRRLKDLSLVKNRREGQVLYYSLVDEHVSELLQLSLTHISE